MLRRKQVALALSVAVLVGASTVVAVDVIDGPATVGVPATRVDEPLGDVVAMFDVGPVDREVVEGAFAVAERAGGAAATARSGSSGMVRITRAGSVVHAPPDGYLIPIVYTAVPHAAAGGLMGDDVASILAPDVVVMNELTAAQTGARVGDVIELRVLDGPVVAFRIAAVKPHTQLGGSEVVLDTAAVERLGVFDDTRVAIWSIDSRAAADEAIAAFGLETRADTQVSRSWSPPSPDDTLSTARLKQVLGEPWYRVTGETTIEMHPTWMANNLTAGRVLLNTTIPVRARCHQRIVADLQAAFAEVAAAGLASAIDVANTNTFGGCFNARYSRLGGFLSRHAYAAAIDMNTVANCLGCVPRMDCRVVQIFRRHGFAWGGNFRRPDGMHFEWVGSRRDQIAYPSTYCPNVVAASAGAVEDTRAAVPSADLLPERGREVLVDGVDEHAHHTH